MLQANQFVPVTFEASVVAFGLMTSPERLAAKLLATHADSFDDDEAERITRQAAAGGDLQLIIKPRGLLTITPAWASFAGSFPEGSDSSSWSLEPLEWAVELLMSILTMKNARVMSLSSEVTWYVPGLTSTAPLVEYLGLSESFEGLFASSDSFRIRGDKDTVLPGLFPVACEFLAGRLSNFEGPDDVGVQIKVRGPDNRIGLDPPTDYNRQTVDRFFASGAGLMADMLVRFFPLGGAS